MTAWLSGKFIRMGRPFVERENRHGGNPDQFTYGIYATLFQIKALGGGRNTTKLLKM
jgi:hypothetical protein